MFKPGTVKTAIGAAILSAAIFSAPASALEMRDMPLIVDIAKLLRLERPAATVVIGNPAIADATVRSGTLMVLMGKSYGATNLIALDGSGEEILHLNLKVRATRRDSVSLYRGISKESYSCDPKCEPTLTIGDRKDRFEGLSKQVSKKSDMAVGGSSLSGGSAQ